MDITKLRKPKKDITRQVRDVLRGRQSSQFFQHFDLIIMGHVIPDRYTMQRVFVMLTQSIADYSIYPLIQETIIMRLQDLRVSDMIRSLLQNKIAIKSKFK
jgi:hypothetical protein